MKAFYFEGELGSTIREGEIPTELKADAQKYRNELVEKLLRTTRK